MNSGSPSPYHSSDTEEEDSPLQQSAFTSNQPTADSYPEDIASEAEEEAEDQTTEEVADGGGKRWQSRGRRYRARWRHRGRGIADSDKPPRILGEMSCEGRSRPGPGK
jgi:hypothetical protein